MTFLAPNMLPVYQFIVTTLSERLGCNTELVVGTKYKEVYNADLSFICGLPYVLRTPPRQSPAPFVAIAAPVLQGERYQDRPIYFSDVICSEIAQLRNLPICADARGRITSRNRNRVMALRAIRWRKWAKDADFSAKWCR